MVTNGAYCFVKGLVVWQNWPVGEYRKEKGIVSRLRVYVCDRYVHKCDEMRRSTNPHWDGQLLCLFTVYKYINWILTAVRHRNSKSCTKLKRMHTRIHKTRIWMEVELVYKRLWAATMVLTMWHSMIYRIPRECFIINIRPVLLGLSKMWRDRLSRDSRVVSSRAFPGRSYRERRSLLSFRIAIQEYGCKNLDIV